MRTNSLVRKRSVNLAALGSAGWRATMEPPIGLKGGLVYQGRFLAGSPPLSLLKNGKRGPDPFFGRGRWSPLPPLPPLLLFSPSYSLLRSLEKEPMQGRGVEKNERRRGPESPWRRVTADSAPNRLPSTCRSTPPSL